MKKLTIIALALSLGLAATGCKKKSSGRGLSDPGMDDGAKSGGCCDTSSDAGGALLPLGFVVLGLAHITRRRARIRSRATGCGTTLPVAKLYFRYGTMDSAKTLNLLAVAHNYRKQGKRVLLVKPRIDTRFGTTTIASRSGLTAEADLVLDEGTALDPAQLAGYHCVLVDEAQFLTPEAVLALRRATIDPGVPVICYGLRTDFRTHLFPGAQRLMELADRIEEVKVTCQYCNGKAICNLRLANGRAAVDGPTVQLGDAEYHPVCWRHYDEAVRAATDSAAPSDSAASP